MICLFTCNPCGYTEREIEVRDRAGPFDEWVNSVLRPAVRGAHMVRSPHCSNRTFEVSVDKLRFVISVEP